MPLPPLIARCRVEHDRCSEITLRQLRGPASALRADCVENDAAPLRPADHANAVRTHLGLRLQKQKRAISIMRPLRVDLAVEPTLRAHLALVPRPEAVNHQHKVAALIEFAGPVELAGFDEPIRPVEETAAAVQENQGGMFPGAGRPEQIPIECGRRPGAGVFD
jgi:hypothetical protein